MMTMRVSVPPAKANLLSLAAVAGLALLLVAAPTASAAPPAPGSLYLDSRLPIATRVEDLLRAMTLGEKIGQMDQIVLGELRDATNPASGDCNNSGGNTDQLQTNCLDNVLV